MKVLIIGGTGNMSTAITRYLLARGEEVVHFNNDVRRPEEFAAVRTIFGDRTRHAEFEAAMAGERFDCVIDMIGYEPEDAESDVRVFAGRTGQFVFCSTVDVYTKPAKRLPVREDEERKPSPAFQYAYNKAVCEEMLWEAHRRGDFPLTVIRPAATYNDAGCPISLLGPGETFLKRVRQGKPLIVLGDGQSIWVSTHRDDVARAIANAVGNPKAYGRAYNVMGEEYMTWEQYYRTVAEGMGAPAPEFVHIPADLLARAVKSADWCDLNFKYNNIFDNSLARAELGFQYTVTWREGVRRMVAYHDGRGAIDGSKDFPLYDRVIGIWRELAGNVVKRAEGLEG